MAPSKEQYLEETQPLTQEIGDSSHSQRASIDSISSASTTSVILERLGEEIDGSAPKVQEELDLEEGPFNYGVGKPIEKQFRRFIWIAGTIFIGAWLLALVVFLSKQA